MIRYVVIKEEIMYSESDMSIYLWQLKMLQMWHFRRLSGKKLAGKEVKHVGWYYDVDHIICYMCFTIWHDRVNVFGRKSFTQLIKYQAVGVE